MAYLAEQRAHRREGDYSMGASTSVKNIILSVDVFGSLRLYILRLHLSTAFQAVAETSNLPLIHLQAKRYYTLGYCETKLYLKLLEGLQKG